MRPQRNTTAFYRHTKILATMTVTLLSTASLSHAQTSINTTGQGSIVVGEDSGTCDSSHVGAMRYNTSTNKIQTCVLVDGSTYDWVNWD